MFSSPGFLGPNVAIDRNEADDEAVIVVENGMKLPEGRASEANLHPPGK